MCSLALVLAACDRISEADRLIYVKPEPAQRVVLIEDFTGQRCTNCPRATDVIAELHATYGESIVAVGIHGGPLAFAGSAKAIGLKTATGDDYYNHWALEYQPVGLINRRTIDGSHAINYTDWTRLVTEELRKPAPLHLGGTATISDDAIDITIQTRGTDGTVQGKLQLWLIEDGITALQLMPDGSANQEYLHNHVFRTAVNGAWGDDITVREAETEERTFTQPLDPAWNTENLSVVAFIYTPDGVQQAVRITASPLAPLP